MHVCVSVRTLAMYEINYISLCGFYSKPNSTINGIPILNDLCTVLAELLFLMGRKSSTLLSVIDA